MPEPRLRHHIVNRNASFWLRPECRNRPDDVKHLLRGNHAGALVLSVVILVTRAPEIVLVVEVLPDIVPASKADLVVYHTVWGVELS